MNKTKRNVHIILSAAIVIALLCILLYVLAVYVLENVGLGGAGDWSFDRLPGNYEIWRLNGKDISLIKMSSEYAGEKAVDAFIVSFCWDQRYIGLHRDPTHNDNPREKAEAEYYIVDSLTEEVLGPFDLEEYKKQSDDLAFHPNDWIQTVPAPEGAK